MCLLTGYVTYEKNFDMIILSRVIKGYIGTYERNLIEISLNTDGNS